MSEFPSKNEIKIGMTVLVELKEDQGTGKLTKGIVREILTTSKNHPHGIMVELKDGQIGRVHKILEKITANLSQTTEKQIRSKIYKRLKNSSISEISKPKKKLTNKPEKNDEISIPKDEDIWNEFKSSFRVDFARFSKGDGKIVLNKNVEKEIPVTISAMANKEGGTLFIGVDDDGYVLGLDQDYELLKHPNDDKFQRIIWQSIQNYIGNMSYVSKLNMSLIAIDSKKICVLTIPASDEAIFVHDNNSQESYVRVGPKSEKFPPVEFMKYCKTRFID